jgi:hypothetical protein
MTLRYSIFAGAVALGLAMAPAAFARAGGGGGGMHGGGFGGGMHVSGMHVGGLGGPMMYGRRGGFVGYGLDYPYYYPDTPAFCSEFPNDYNPAEGCYGLAG